MASEAILRLGTRASKLARWQADWVAAKLAVANVQVQLVPITTTGDEQRSGPVGGLGTQGVFTKEIQRALLDDSIDIAVHSLKDLPTEEIPGLVLGAVPVREAVGDALLARNVSSLAELPSGAIVGTGSLRRQAQILHARPDLQMQDIRGNVETRIGKLDAGDYDAIILAQAGLDRLELSDRITQRLPLSICLSAVGQGALGIECRADDATTRELIAVLDESQTHSAALAERALLASLRGGCLAPVAGWARFEDDLLHLTARVLSHDGQTMLEHSDSDTAEAAIDLGQRVAQALRGQGSDELIAAAREQN